MINKSFQLIRTNPALTTNIKLVVNADYKLYLESFDTNKQLSDQKYKHFLINKDNFYEDQIINFYDGLSSNLAFDVKYDSDVSDVFSTYDKQFDDIYWGGAKSVEDNWYDEDNEYFAPLFIRKGDIPEGFIILRVDDSIPYDELVNEFGPSELNKDNFHNQIVDKWKCVNLFDMRYETDFGYFLHNNYVDNIGFPDKSFELDFREYEYSKIYGIDYINGVYVTKSKFLQDLLYFEQPHFKLEKEILNSFRSNDLIFPNILNIKYLFNDIPASPNKINNYSLNRYYGFYINKLEFVTNLTSYITPSIKNDIRLNNNIFVDLSGNTISESPFIEGYYADKTYWIQYDCDFYKVIRTFKDDKYVYQIISDFDMSGLTFNSINDRTCIINYETGTNYQCRTIQNPSGYTNFISGFTNNFIIDPYNIEGETKSMYGDLYLINIDGIYHVLKERNGEYYIHTDYAINSYPDRLEYWKGGKNSKYYINKDVYNYGEKPLSYPVYRLKFCDIKDFDFNIVNTHFSDFDYEKDHYISTPEHKLYATDYNNSSVLNKSFMVHPRGEFGQYQIMNVSSEYISDDELYEISFNNLTDIWRKNQYVTKWGFAGSNSKCDYPYKLNNSIDVGDIFNGTCNIVSSTPNIIEKNLDYFYRIGNFYSNGQVVRYLNQTTNIEVDFMADFSKKFNLDLYLKSDVDYFDYFFKNKSYIEIDSLNYTKPTMKYSTFQSGDKYTYSNTLFKGININAIKIKNISRDSSGKILNIISDNSKNFNNYKFSIILNDVYEYYDGTTYTDTIENGLTENHVIDKNVNGIHVFLNEKYKNFLIIINIKIPMQQNLGDFNNIDMFDEKIGLYTAKTKNGDSIIHPAYVSTEYNPSLITASNFINAFDDMNTLSEFDSGITYYYITNDSISGITQTGTTGAINTLNPNDNNMSNVSSWGKNDPPFILSINRPEIIKTKKNSYIKSAINGPTNNIYDKYSVYYNQNEKQKYNVIDPLARKMELNIAENNMNTVYASNSVAEPNYIYRFNGTYEPIMTNIALFNNVYLYSSGTSIKQWDANYKFDTSYVNFGIIEELIYSKVNPNSSPLKLKNTDKDKSIYPMCDEYGYQFGARFMFNSSWDKDYYILTNSEQDVNKNIFANLSNIEYIINPLKPKL